MSLRYSINIKINKKIKNEYIETILTRGTALSIEYFEVDYDIPFHKKLDIQEATKAILNKKPIIELNHLDLIIQKEFSGTLLLSIGENDFTIILTSLNLTDINEIDDRNEIYLAKCAKIILNMTQDFPISSINVEHDKYPIEYSDEIDNKFYSRISAKFDKLFIENFLQNAIKNNILFKENELTDQIFNSLKELNNPVKIEFKIDDEEGILTLKRNSPSFDEFSKMTDIEFETKEKDWTVDIDVTLTNLKQNWVKKFSDGTEALDLSRYANLMLNLSEGFELKELKIGKL